MKYILFCLLFVCACKKDCKTVTIKVINGCKTPAETTTIVSERKYCDEELEEVRKQANKVAVDMGGGVTCYITTVVIEE